MSALRKLRAVAASRNIVALTAWDYPTGLLAESAGMDLVLVGDSLSIVALGNDRTATVTLDQMVHHTRAVTRAMKTGFVMADLPLGSYEKSPEHAIDSALRLIKEGRADGVKLEGGEEMGPTIQAITRAGVAVIGHIGMTPQRGNNSDFGQNYTDSDNECGSVDRESDARMAKQTVSDAFAVQRAGAAAVVLEAVPAQLAAYITKKLQIPTIGLGSGPACSGQILLQSEALGYQTRLFSEWQKRYSSIGEQSLKALLAYAADVKQGSFPTAEQSYELPEEDMAQLPDSHRLEKPWKT